MEQEVSKAAVQEKQLLLSRLLARLAHEIRNPLSSITLNIDLVGDEITTLATDGEGAANEARSLLRSIDSEVRRIQRVTEDYLQFARMPKPRRERISLNDAISQGLSFMESLFAATGVKVVVNLDPSLNLVRNAIEAMPDGGTLTVRTTRARAGVALTIADTGKGMAAEDREQIFKPFFSTKPSGTGLGLPLVQQVVAEHGGTIRCESAPDQGTTFIIELPSAKESTHAPKS